MTKNTLFYFAALAFSLGWLYFNFLALPAPVDCGDGLMHFFISQASWENPIFFLDHWGKPLFVLLSSSFAQVGFGGMTTFNSFVFLLTILFGWKILKKYKIPLSVQLTLPFLLLLTPDYATTILGGLTEPLFGLFLVALCWAWLEDKFILFALLAGATLFLRSEGQLVVFFAFGLLLYIRQGKSIPFLFAPFIFYAIVGFFATNDFWWYFTKSPYSMDNSSYGKGSYSHYLTEFKTYLGIHGLTIAILGLSGLAVQIVKKQLSIKIIGFLILAFGTFFGIIAAHSYFYGSGQNGSMGLTRIATQGLPALIVASLYFFGALLHSQDKGNTNWLFSLPAMLVFLLCTTPYLKKEENRINTALLSTADFIKQESKLKNKTIYAYHPLLAYALGSNVKMKNQKLKQFSGKSFLADKNKLTFGDIIVWDSQFGPFEIGLPFQNLLADTNFILSHQEIIPGNLEANGVFLFQYVPAYVKKQSNSRLQEKTLLSNKNISSKKEFIDVFKIPSSKDSYALKIKCKGAKNIHFVCVPVNNSDYQAIDLQVDSMSFEFSINKEIPYLLYLWNPSKVAFSVDVLGITQQLINLPKIWTNVAN